MGWRAYKTFQPAVSPVARHCYLFGGLFGQVGWSLGHNIHIRTPKKSLRYVRYIRYVRYVIDLIDLIELIELII